MINTADTTRSSSTTRLHYHTKCETICSILRDVPCLRDGYATAPLLKDPHSMSGVAYALRTHPKTSTAAPSASFISTLHRDKIKTFDGATLSLDFDFTGIDIGAYTLSNTMMRE